MESVGRAREADASMPAALDPRIGRDPDCCPFLSVQSTLHLGSPAAHRHSLPFLTPFVLDGME